MKAARVLFVCKYRHSYNAVAPLSSGLFNSAIFVSNMLNNINVPSKVVQVKDDNDIDREVTKYHPTHVIIEALWIVPTKFEVLFRLHPEVQWIVRMHSETPFIAGEGIAEDWIFRYAKLYPRLQLSFNSYSTVKEYAHLLHLPVIYTPNYYPVDTKEWGQDKERHDNVADIGCFGAIRPLKNHLMQAHAAIEFAEDCNKQLRFHINVGRQEQKGEQVYKNLVNLFNNTKHTLVEVDWLPHDEFLEYIRHNIDVGMQVSLTESFNIVSADIVNCNIPIVVSDEVSWMTFLFKANPSSCDSIIHKLKLAWNTQPFKLYYLNKFNLWRWSNYTKHVWKNYFSPCE